MSQDFAQAPEAPRKNSRRWAREFALQGIYQWLVSGNEAVAVEAHLRDEADFAHADRKLFQRLLHGAIDNAESLRGHFVGHLDRPLAELSPVEHAVLLLATCELALHIETPYRVVINEAIELAKSFGGADGHKFVNGVLDKLAPDLRAVEAQADARRAPRRPQG